MVKWKNVNVPESQIKQIQELLKSEHVQQKYCILTVPEFIRHAINDKIKQIKRELQDLEQEH